MYWHRIAYSVLMVLLRIYSLTHSLTSSHINCAACSSPGAFVDSPQTFATRRATDFSHAAVVRHRLCADISSHGALNVTTYAIQTHITLHYMVYVAWWLSGRA